MIRSADGIRHSPVVVLGKALKCLSREWNHCLNALSFARRWEREQWIRHDGTDFFRRIGLEPGDTVVDFGCGPGSYSLPAAARVGPSGRVVALDARARALRTLFRRARKERTGRIIRTAQHLSEIPALLGSRLCQAILAYDVLHFMDADERKALYALYFEWLADDGVLSVHPKHLKDDQPSRYFGDLDAADIIREIERARFRLRERKTMLLWHDTRRQQGRVLNFTKGS